MTHNADNSLGYSESVLKKMQSSSKFTTNQSHTLIAIPVSYHHPDPILQYDPESNEWNEIGTLKLERHNFRVVYTNKSQLIFFGGVSRKDDKSKKACNNVLGYDLNTGKWQKLSFMQKCRVFMSIAELGEHIYVIGGMDESGLSLNSVERFNTDCDKWYTVSSMQDVRSYAATVVFNGKIYVIGGYTDKATLRSVECYNPQTDTWRRLADMHEARNTHGAAVAYDKIYVLGGGNEEKGWLRSVECYNPERNEWTKVCSLHAERVQICSIFFNNRLMTLGSYENSTVEEYDFEQNVWIERGTHSILFCYHRILQIN